MRGQFLRHSRYKTYPAAARLAGWQYWQEACSGSVWRIAGIHRPRVPHPGAGAGRAWTGIAWRLVPLLPEVKSKIILIAGGKISYVATRLPADGEPAQHFERFQELLQSIIDAPRSSRTRKPFGRLSSAVDFNKNDN